MGARKLESTTLIAVQAAGGFIERRIFKVARRPVYTYCSGDIGEKLSILEHPATPDASDPNLRKAQQLLRFGYPKIHVIRAFELLAEAPWSILRYEQMHGAGAAQHRQHPEQGPESHAAKTAVNLMLPMVRVGAPLERRTKEEVRLASLRRKMHTNDQISRR